MGAGLVVCGGEGVAVLVLGRVGVLVGVLVGMRVWVVGWGMGMDMEMGVATGMGTRGQCRLSRLAR